MVVPDDYVLTHHIDLLREAKLPMFIVGRKVAISTRLIWSTLFTICRHTANRLLFVCPVISTLRLKLVLISTPHSQALALRSDASALPFQPSAV